MSYWKSKTKFKYFYKLNGNIKRDKLASFPRRQIFKNQSDFLKKRI